MQRIATALALVLLAAASAEAADLAVSLRVKDKTPALGAPLSVEVAVENEGKRSASVREVVHDIRSAYLEIAYADRTFEFMKIDNRYFEFIFQRKKIEEYLSPLTLKPGASARVTLSLVLPRAGSYRLRGVYAGVTPSVRSDWTEVTVAPKGKKEELRVAMKTSHGDLTLAFHPDVALGTVLNFLGLVHEKFYDGVVFHRIIKDFMSQGGDPDGTGRGGPGYLIPQEFNDLPHGEGVLSMARTGAHVDTAGSQFFLCVAMSPEMARNLDRQYTVFGQVVEGLDVVRKINSIPAPGSKPSEEVKIVTARLVLE